MYARYLIHIFYKHKSVYLVYKGIERHKLYAEKMDIS